MVLDKIKSKTTWSDASASLNENFARILKGIREGIPTIETPVDEQMSDESENAVQNKVIKKYVDDEAVHLEGYAEELVNHLEDDIKANPSKYVKLKTVNGKSLYGAGNIVIEGGEGTGGGLQYAIERTVYPSRLIYWGQSSEWVELSDEERAYNVETYRMAAMDREPVFLSVGGYFLPLLDTSTSEGRARFGIVVTLYGLDSISVTITGDGDAIIRGEGIDTGSSAPRDMNSDFSKDF